MGDPGKLLILEEVLKVIKRDHLLQTVEKAGKKLKDGLFEMEKQYPHLLSATRGRGTFLAISCATHTLRDDILNNLKQKGNISNTSVMKEK